MERIFGLPTTLLAWITGVSWLLITLGIAWLGIRQPVLLRLALRPIPRRKVQTALVTLGLMLSTTIMTSSLGAGDTMSQAVRSLVNTSVGRVDELVVLSEPEGWRERRRALRGLQQGDVLAAATRSEFPYAEYERLAQRVSNERSIAATVPAIVQLRTVVNERSKLTAPDVKLLAVPANYSPVFGPLTSDAGSVGLGDLEPDEVYVNAEAATALAATTGDRVQVLQTDSFGSPRPWRVRIREVVRAPGLAGSQATILVPLHEVWAHDPAWSADGYLNAILVANSGHANSSLDRSAEATRALRVAVADPTTAKQLHALLSSPLSRSGLESYVEEFEVQAGLLDQEEVRLLRALVTEVARSSPSPEFVSLLGDPELVAELGRFARERWELEGVYEAGDLLAQLHPLSVREIKRQGLSRADLAGSVITSIFLVLGLFSMAVGVLLIFLLWVMLAAERRTEMGTGRALGLQRRHLLQMFLFEGTLYSALSATVGVLCGILVARVAVALLAGIAGRYGVTLEPYLAPRSLVLAFSLGALLTIAVVAICSWRITHLTIVAALHNLPERRTPPRRANAWQGLRSGAVRASLLLVLGILLVLAGQRLAQVGVRGLGETLVLVGTAELVRWIAGRARLQGLDRGVWTVLGLLLILYWGRSLPEIAESQSLPMGNDVEVFVLSGIIMVLGGVWTVAHNLALLVKASERILRRAPRGAVLV
ncbi:MAG: ABC transporter permease, partial [Chloroflexota bacterium]|nr:ABC transporter permease [Chloroflexota bacterium]